MKARETQFDAACEQKSERLAELTKQDDEIQARVARIVEMSAESSGRIDLCVVGVAFVPTHASISRFGRGLLPTLWLER